MSKINQIKQWVADRKSKIKFWIAGWIDQLDPNVCWASLAGWCTGLSDDVSIFPWSENYPSGPGGCEITAYCGKCSITGRLSDPDPKVLNHGDQYFACLRSKNTGKHYLKSLFYIKFKRFINRLRFL